jgi:flagellar basal-body rod protein FlgF/flagellar basal-body rod protein FlgG
MDSGYYAACTALMTQSQALELVANNLANSSTSGFRAQHSVFQSLVASSSGTPISPLNEAANQYGVLEGSRVDLAQGALEQTGNDLDLAIEGPGFFVVQTSAGRRLTRNGGFHVAHNQLVTSDGDPVMGENGVVQIVGGPVSIAPDGTVSVNGAVAGKLKLVEIKPGTPLESTGGTYYTAPQSTEIADTHSNIRQGMIEASNVNAVSATVELITIQRQYDLMRRALSIFDSQFNQTAAQDLPRIS